MPSNTTLLILAPLVVALAVLVAFLIYAAIRYAPIIGRIFEEKPLFLPLRAKRAADGEDVRFTTADGIELAGTYFRERAGRRAGVVVFCHEFLGDRWSCQPYADHLRDRGFDVFTFDFRNHGESGHDPIYRPLQWVTDHEVNDLRAALAYLRSRPDCDPAGVGLFGISRGGGTGLVVAADEPTVWGVVTDGAFPTRGTMLAYILRWAEIYVSNPFLWRKMPLWVFQFLGWVGRIRSEKRLACRFPDVERAVARLAPRPWFMIHGEKDAYIGPDIARALFAEARDSKELWIVPGAKHNRCREVQNGAYLGRVAEFFAKSAPRRASLAAKVSPVPDPSWKDEASPRQLRERSGTPAIKNASELAAPVSG